MRSTQSGERTIAKHTTNTRTMAESNKTMRERKQEMMSFYRNKLDTKSVLLNFKLIVPVLGAVAE